MPSVRRAVRSGVVLFFAGFALFACGDFACGDDDTSPPDPPVVSIDLLAPLGGETWGATGTIRWQSQNATTHTVNVLLSDDSGASYPETLAADVPHTSTHDWNLWDRAEGSTYGICGIVPRAPPTGFAWTSWMNPRWWWPPMPAGLTSQSTIRSPVCSSPTSTSRTRTWKLS